MMVGVETTDAASGQRKLVLEPQKHCFRRLGVPGGIGAITHPKRQWPQ
jgi:hypothetical protein